MEPELQEIVCAIPYPRGSVICIKTRYFRRIVPKYEGGFKALILHRLLKALGLQYVPEFNAYCASAEHIRQLKNQVKCNGYKHLERLLGYA